MIENITLAETQKQTFLVAPPPLHARKQKASKDCYLSFLDQIQGGDYGGAKLVRKEPRTNRDIYFLIRTRKTEVRSHRRNYSHKSIALFRTKRDGSTRKNIAYMTGSFLELDGSNDSTIKTQGDVLALIAKNNLPQASYAVETSQGHFHILWNYNDPLPWTTKNESYWFSQQKRLIQLFQKAGFNVDEPASTNPVQNLRNPSELQPYNYKRRCKVQIHKSYTKTSLRAIFRALNKTSITNPRPLPASVKLRRFLRANKTFEITHAELAENLNMSLRTVKTQVSRAVQNGDLRIVARLGNNSGKVRTTQYESPLFIEKFPGVQHSISKNNASKKRKLLLDFQANGAENGRRNNTLFVLAVGLSCESNKTLTVREIADQLRGGAIRSGLGEREFLRTIKNAVKPIYNNFFSFKKMKQWDLIKKDNHFH